MKKECKKCNQIEEHYPSNRHRDGMRNPCKKCILDPDTSQRVNETPKKYFCKVCGEEKQDSKNTRCEKCYNRKCKHCGTQLPSTGKRFECEPCRTTIKRYGINTLDKKEIWETQNKSCAICYVDLPFKGKSTHIDHCHTTGKVRGILCSKCNSAIGLLGEDPMKFAAASRYLDKWHNTDLDEYISYSALKFRNAENRMIDTYKSLNPILKYAKNKQNK